MTQKGKAEEIVLKYYIKRIDFFYKDEQNRESIEIGKMTWYSAKQCAKIHVNGIIEYIKNDITIGSKESKLAELNEVLEEIDKL